MSDVAIKVDGLGKQYRIGGPQAKYKTIRETIMDGARTPFRRAGQLLRGQAYGAANLDQTIWALKDVSFEVKHGEVVGIIGRNGAGKSTLLKILSQITEPTEGEVMLRGRVGSLLEVGTGFHPELTGRENIYLNGAILGMKRTEIARKFDEIVDFSEIEKFIDTPVKHYSSGMYVRLAFSVAAHMEPNILLVDEVLAVGDAAFQKKCLGKMDAAAKGGRTVFFVSHNLPVVLELCTSCYWFHSGQVRDNGDTQRVVTQYLNSTEKELAANNFGVDSKFASGKIFWFSSVSLLDEKGKSVRSVTVRDPLKIHFEFETTSDLEAVRIGLVIHNLQGVTVFASHHTDTVGLDYLDLARGRYQGLAVFDVPLAPGTYILDMFAKTAPGFWKSAHRSLDWIQGVVIFQVEPASMIGSSLLDTGGLLLPEASWNVQRL